ncbi:hypothetical protein STCU_09188 [Strigomonas culicis]|uniref:Cyclic nucleotide-binding domain-containing protein n=1 Tax=Strigomonas culicis TaxID=28005 RepID=S9VAH8_9TRYP|nr:hypothetical protein STCU_09188 [Strigomonas culicis]|eukprot:EPY20030.1 hypothetical protein STCU_09188 [Strigomonas culicis]
MPSEEVLKQHPLLSKWPLLPIKNVLRLGKLCAYRKGCSVAYNKEPLSTCSIFWVISGKLMQVPSKKEIKRCALEIPTLFDTKLPKTGPLVFPSLFSSVRHTPATRLQESVLDGLSTFSAGQLIDAELLLFGALRRRSIACLTDVVLVSIPFLAFQNEFLLLKGPPHRSTIEEARKVVTAALANGNAKPPLADILSANSVLTALNPQSLKAIWMQLQPTVFKCGEIICNNTYTSDTVFFLSVGKVKYVTEKSRDVLVRSRGACMGLNSIISFELPTHLLEKRTVVAASYCELWFISTRAFLCLCDEGDKVNCSRQATKEIDIAQCSLNLQSNLRNLAVFASVSDVFLNAVVKSLKMRVYMPGDCIIPAKKVFKSGVIILCGEAYIEIRNKGGKGETREPARVGSLYYLCEALVGIKMPNAIVAGTSVIVALISAGCIFDALEKSEWVSTEMDSIMEMSHQYVEKVYGGDAAECKAQETAQKRVNAFYEKEQAKKAQTQKEVQKQVVKDSVLSELEEENNLFTSLSTQLEYLRHSELEAEKYRYLSSPNNAVVTTQQAPISGQAGGAARKCSGCFTTDDRGKAVYCDEVPQGWRRKQRPAEGNAVSAVDRAYSQDRGFAPAPPAVPASSSPNLGAAAGTRRIIPSRDLYVPAVIRRPNDNTLTGNRAMARSSPPPRLAALRTEVSQMKDDADGFDRRQEYRRAST